MTGGFVLVILMLAALGAWVLMFSVASARINLWALREHLSILQKRFCWLYKGPFAGTVFDCVFRVVVADPEGLRRSAYIAVGGEFLGLVSRAFTVKWDDAR